MCIRDRLELVGGKEILRKTNGVIIDTIDERDGLQSNLIQDIYQSKDGDVYIATLGGGISILKKNNYKAVSYTQLDMYKRQE